MAKETILVSSGYSNSTIGELKKIWHVLDIPSHAAALEYLQSCKSLPVVVAIGHVERTPSGARPEWSESETPKLPAHIMLRKVLDIDCDLPVIISAGEVHAGAIVELIKRGAFDYVTEPRVREEPQLSAYTQELVLALQRAAKWRMTVLENRSLRQTLDDRPQSSQFITRNANMMKILHMVSKVASTAASVLITGESGTGKELVARMIHERSNRSRKPFVTVNCGSLSESLLASELFGHAKGAFTGADVARPGLIRQAGDGTLLLDEIGTISPGFQVMLLRVLEEKMARPVGSESEYPVRCRFIAAGNRDLAEMSRNGEFREDLYYRLNMFHLDLPPLRKRSEDIPVLADHFLQRFAGEYKRKISGFAPEAMAELERMNWPGNVRQLRNCVERAVILCDGQHIKPVDLIIPERPKQQAGFEPLEQDYEKAMQEFEKMFLKNVLAKNEWNILRAAKALNMNRTTLLYRIRKLELKS